MPNLIDAAEWTDNEVYEIQVSDRLSGAGPNTENGGIGVLNLPLSKLANRTAFLKGRQDVNIGNINSLLAFMAKFVITLAPGSVVLRMPVADTALGQIQLLLQGGLYAPPGGIATPQSVSVPFNVPFPTACLVPPIAVPIDDGGVGVGVSACSVGIAPSVSAFTCNVGFSGGSGVVEGIAWWAVGY